MVIVSIDFSINSSAITIFNSKANTYRYLLFTSKITKHHRLLDEKVNINDKNTLKIVNFNRLEKVNDFNNDYRTKMQESLLLNALIMEELNQYLNKQTIVVFESASYGSAGNALLDLTAYSHLLKIFMPEHIDINNLYHITPSQLKKFFTTKGNADKPEMMKHFLLEGTNLSETVFETGLTYKQAGVNDLVDSYALNKCIQNQLSI